MILGVKGTFSQVFRLEKKKLWGIQCFPLVLHVCCITHMRFQGNINIGSPRWIPILYENMFKCSIKPTDAVFIFSSIKVCFSLSCGHYSGLFPLLVLPLANLFFPPFDDFTVSFLLPCVKIVKEVRPALPFTRLIECRQFTHLHAIVSGCLQIHSDTSVSVTVSSCFQGYLCNQEN